MQPLKTILTPVRYPFAVIHCERREPIAFEQTAADAVAATAAWQAARPYGTYCAARHTGTHWVAV